MATLSTRNHPFKGYMVVHPDMGTEMGTEIYRALVHDEVGFDYCLRKMPSQFDVAEFRAMGSQGRAALEQDDWTTAEMRFLRCKEMLSAGSEERVGIEYCCLVVWVNHFLAQSYQAMGSDVDTLLKRSYLRKEIFACVLLLIRASDNLQLSELLRVCFIFLITDLYELGEASGDSSNEKKVAIYRGSEMWSCSDDDAEARLCFMLCCDHECLGRFNESLRWIRKAIRVRMKDSLGWSRCKLFFLEHEARLLLRLQMFSEAEKALKELCTSKDTRAVRELLHECYTQMSRRTADVQQAKAYEELATDCMWPLPTKSAGDVPTWGPLRMFMPFHLGSSGLGLARAPEWRGVDLHLSKLPVSYSILFQDRCNEHRGALQHCDWETAAFWSEQMREILKIIRGLLPTESYDWLLCWVDLPLAGLYHHHARRYDKALKIWEEIQECEARSNLASPDKLELNTSKGYQIPFAALEYEMSISNSSPKGKEQIIQKWTRAYCTDEETAERELCFWLYFGYHRHGNYEHALEWLQMEKKLRSSGGLRDGLHSNGVCSGKRGRNIDYFCCDYDYKRCEIDLFMKLGRHEDGVAGLECLLNTEQCVQEGGFVDDIDDDQLVDKGVQGQVPTANPTATGCILLVEQSAWLSPLGVRRAQLIQSLVGLEHHLLKLPFPIQLAFRKHGYLGRLYNMELLDWENAIFQFECCLEILETIPRNPKTSKTYDWLNSWVLPPLADLFEHMKQYWTAYELRLRVVEKIFESRPGILGGDQKSEEKDYLVEVIFLGMYLWAISAYPNDSYLKRKVIKSCNLVLDLEDDWSVEYRITRVLGTRFAVMYENYEVALDFLQRAKQLLDERYQEPHQISTEEYELCVLMEHLCLWHLQRPDEAKEVVYNYQSRTGKKRSELPKVLQMALEGRDIKLKIHDLNRAALRVDPEVLQMALEGRDIKLKIHDLNRAALRVDHTSPISAELNDLRRKSREYETKKEYAKAISYREKCLQLTRKNPNLEGLENSQDVRLGFKDKLAIAEMYLGLLEDASRQEHEAFCWNENYELAVKYYKQCLRLFSEGVVFLYLHINTVAYITRGLLRVHMTALFLLVGDIWKSLQVYSMQFFRRLDFFSMLECLRKLPVHRLGERLIALCTWSLHTLGSKQYTEGWIEWLEDHKLVYSYIQFYYAVLSFFNHFFQSNSAFIPIKPPTSDPFYTQRGVDASNWNAFLFAEGERTRVMMYEYEMHRRKSLKSHEVRKWGFDAHDRGALKYIKESCRALLDRESTVFVQYSAAIDVPYIYVIMIDQDGCKLFMERGELLSQDEGIISKNRPTPQKRLDDLYDYLAYKQRHPDHTEICQDKEYKHLRRKSTITDDKSMNKYLEFLYGALIGPIESHLDKVKPGGKLVLAPSELLTRVPFAALRKPGKDQERLIQRYALTIVPSLRVLQMCSERLQELQNDSRPYTGRCGSIVALGNPTYDCAECDREGRQPLADTEQEVKKLVALFGDTAVMTLTERDATAKKLLEWAAKPSQESFRQAIVHIGAHGHIEKDDYRKNKLQLACDPSVSISNAHASTSSGDQAKVIDMSLERGKADDEYIEDDCSDGDESDSAVQELVHDDGTPYLAELALLHRFMTTRCGSELGLIHTNPLVTNESSSIASSSKSSATIGRFPRGSSASSHDLTVEAINNLETRWTAELLVLSACQTSAGRITAEGVLSLARAFMAAGVPCVVASLWKVDDAETLALMVDFYDELWKGSDVASALQSATLHCMARRGHDAVQYWAPFNVWGVPSLRIPKELQQKEAPQPAGDDDSSVNREEGMEAHDGNAEDDVP